MWNGDYPSASTKFWHTVSPREADVVAADFGSECLPGTPLIVLRRGYRHHGVYAGCGRVIHYAGLTRYRRGCIEEVSLEDFVGNRPIQFGKVPDEACGRDIVRRARSRLGECRYDLLNNNCEHFCNWCLRGESRSDQIDTLIGPIRALAHLTLNLLVLFPTWAPSSESARGVPS